MATTSVVLMLLASLLGTAGICTAQADEYPRDAAGVTATFAIEVTDASISIESGGALDTQPLKYPQPVPETLSLATDAAAKLVVAFAVRRAGGDGDGFKPHQAFVRVTHVDSGAAAYFRAKPGGDLGAHRASFGVEDIAAQAGGGGGLYDLALLVGDEVVSSPVQWNLGQVTVPASRVDVVAAPADSKPEIQHVFRQPEKPPPATISLFFAGLQVALFLGLVFVLLRSIDSLKGLPRTAGGATAALAFHSSVFGILGLYLSFWVQLSILQLLPLLTVAGFVTAVSGYLCLSHLASRPAP